MSEWQPIETAPKDGSLILTYDGCNSRVVEWWSEFKYWDYIGDGFYRSEFSDHDPTHWMPLPAPPAR